MNSSTAQSATRRLAAALHGGRGAVHRATYSGRWKVLISCTRTPGPIMRNGKKLGWPPGRRRGGKKMPDPKEALKTSINKALAWQKSMKEKREELEEEEKAKEEGEEE